MDLEDLREKARWIRSDVICMTYKAGKGHIGGTLSAIDILVSLYYSNIFDFTKDKFILSKGHACAALYAILAGLDYFPIELLDTFNQEGSILEGHASYKVPGIDITTGSLGQGLGIATGIAWGMKLKGLDNHAITLMGDGECYEGTVWEAAMLASHHQLSNLIVIIDRNKQCVLDFTEDCNRLEPLVEKWQAFGWHVIEVDGHDFTDLLIGLNQANLSKNKPVVIIANTIKGKGISFMEGKLEWHHGTLTKEQYEQAMNEIWT